MTNIDEPAIHTGRIVLGTAIMVLGLVFLMDHMHLVGAEMVATFWPLLFVVYGLTRIIVPSRPGAEVGGLWIALFGWLFMLDRLNITSVRESWPVFLIVGGLLVVFRALGWLPSSRSWRGVPRRWHEAGR